MTLGSSRVRFGPLRVAGAVAAAAALALTSGCGVSAQTLRPGTAATVGDTSISMSTLDDTTTAYCAYQATNPQGGTAITGYAGRTQMLEGLVLRAVADGMNATYHVTPGPVYTSQLQSDKEQVAQVEGGQQSVILNAVTGTAYFYDLVGQFGAGPGAAAPTTNEEAAANFNKGFPLAEAWVAQHPIVTDPSLPTISLADPNLAAPAGHELSVPVSGFAQAAVDAAQPTPTGDATQFVASLPSSQRCG